MDTRFYECDDELAVILQQHGLVETTSQIDKRKGKKEFRLGPAKSRLVLRFDYVNLEIFENGSGCKFVTGKISAADLKMLLWYIGSNANDKNHISDGHFDLSRVRQNVQTMASLLGYSKEFNCRNAESKRFERLLNNLQSVQLN
ncbi:hypothetical protein ACFJIV_12660 [Mucilaginibacter sp. UC70_90]